MITGLLLSSGLSIPQDDTVKADLILLHAGGHRDDDLR